MPLPSITTVVNNVSADSEVVTLIHSNDHRCGDAIAVCRSSRVQALELNAGNDGLALRSAGQPRNLYGPAWEDWPEDEAQTFTHRQRAFCGATARHTFG